MWLSLHLLNTVVWAYFDAAEFRAMNREPAYMAAWLAHLDRPLSAMGAAVPEGAGSVSRQEADEKSHAKFDRYRIEQAKEISQVERQYLETLSLNPPSRFSDVMV